MDGEDHSLNLAVSLFDGSVIEQSSIPTKWKARKAKQEEREPPSTRAPADPRPLPEEQHSRAEDTLSSRRQHGLSEHARGEVPIDLSCAAAQLASGAMNGFALAGQDGAESAAVSLSGSANGVASAIPASSIDPTCSRGGPSPVAAAQGGLMVATDQSDYAPGSTVTITVSGVTPGGSVTVQIADLATKPGINGIADVYTPFTITAGANGRVVAQWQVPSDGRATGAMLQLTATSGTQTATTTFSDSPNPIVLENQQPGTPQSTWAIHGSISNQGDSQIEGFATQISTNAGQTVSFKIDTASSGYTLDIYRLGYYGGDGARLITVCTMWDRTTSRTLSSTARPIRSMPAIGRSPILGRSLPMLCRVSTSPS